MTSRPATVHIHHAGDRSVDGILRLIAVAGEDAPLEQALTTMCRELAAITEVDVVSAYVREPDEDGVDRLVMRGNHGFPPGAIGAVRLSFGEGLTGLCAECLRPVSVAVGPDERHFKLVPGLGEEQFPAYLGVPLIGGGRALGVLVLQRRARTGFTPTEVTLATALAAPVTLAVERRFGRAAMARSARLDGVTVAPGSAVARATILPTLAALGERGDLDIAGALARLPTDLERARRRLRKHGDADAQVALAEVELLLLDGRLHERVAAAPPTVAGLATVARDYARAPFKVAAAHGHAPAFDRAAEVEDLLVLLGVMASDAAALPPGGIWIGERVGGLVALVACARAAGAIVVEGAATPAAAAIARADDLAVAAEVRGLHAWVRPGDRCTVDADADGAAVVRVNPPAVAIEDTRRRRATES